MKLSMTAQMIVAMVVGIGFGCVCPAAATAIAPGADIFLRLIKSTIAPLVFCTLVSGIAGSEHGGSLGKIGFRCFIYFEVVTTLALAVGLLIVNVIRPGDGVIIGASDPASALSAMKQLSVSDMLTHAIPSSVIDAMDRGDVLQIVVFALIFAIATRSIREKRVIDFCETVSQVMFKFVGMIMKLAPLAVLCGVAATVGEHGLASLASLGKLVASLYLALAVFIVAVLVPIALLFKIPIVKFARAVKEPFIIAFSTASSEAAFPRALEILEKFGVSRRVATVVLPLGYAFNLDGSTLYLALASIFIAQAAHVTLTLPQQLLMMGTLLLSSKGVAQVPRASLVVLAGTLTSFNLPVAGIAIILGVDTFMDMARTSVNVLGNCLAASVVARCEGEFNDSPEAVPPHVEPETLLVPS